MCLDRVQFALAAAFCFATLVSCGDIHRSFTGSASDGSLVSAEVNMIGISSALNPEKYDKEDHELFSVRLESTKGWTCGLDYKRDDFPENSLPIVCSDGARGLLLPSGGSAFDGRSFRFGLSNGISGSAMR